MTLEDFISTERLQTYRGLTTQKKHAIALHNHTLQLGSSLMSMIALLELALRNVTNLRLIEDFGDDQWLLPGHAALPLKSFEQSAISKAHSHAQRGAYSKLSYKQKAYLDAFAFPAGVPTGTSHKMKVKKRQSLFVVSHGQVISQTTLSFWKRLYASEYEQDLWKPSLKKVFPNKDLKRSEIASSLETIYAARNRVAHHEPIYDKRLAKTMESLDFIRNALASKKLDSESTFKAFSKVHWLRLQMDYESFCEAWRTLT
ncbi:hypothetical protein AAG593_15035 [Citromicrobium bathyomarinum]